jgi:hypothetical protein
MMMAALPKLLADANPTAEGKITRTDASQNIFGVVGEI